MLPDLLSVPLYKHTLTDNSNAAAAHYVLTRHDIVTADTAHIHLHTKYCNQEQ